MLPASWKKIPITGRFVGRDGIPVVGKIAFDSAQSIEVEGQLVVPRVIEFVLDAEGRIPDGAELPSTDDPDLSVVGWPYTVHERWPRGRKPYQILIPHDAVSVNIPDASPVVPPPMLSEIPPGGRGMSAYQVALSQGFDGTEAEWLSSLAGQDGADGSFAASFRGAWDGGPASAGDLWRHNGAVWLALQDSSAAPSDSTPETWQLVVSDGSGASAISPVVPVSATTRAITQDDSGSYLRFTADAEISATFAVGEITASTEVHIANRSSYGVLTLIPAEGVQLFPPAGGTLILDPGHTVSVKGVADDQADVIGATVPA